MPGDFPAGSVTKESPFVFQPPAGGDLTLQSCDGTRFQVHSVLLGLASTVFSDMLTGATKSDTVELAEDAETISLMLAFIYPVDPPVITTLDHLEKAMLLSQKYDIARMIKAVERCKFPNNQLILSDPVRVFRASIKHNFPEIRTLSAKASGTSHIDPYSIKGLEELAAKFPESSSIIGLIGAQLVRSKLLAELLKGPSINTEFSPLIVGSCSSSDSMACSQCWSKSRRRDPRSGSDTLYQYTPGWMPLWLITLHDRLMGKPMDPCKDLLSLLFIADLCDDFRSGCSDCVKQTLTKRLLFEIWARNAKNIVDAKLNKLDTLHSL
ncbi:hypothetical protein ACGC1H_004836 [Rhizoctonia solani]